MSKSNYSDTNRVKMFPVGSELDKEEFRKWAPIWAFVWAAWIFVLLIGAAMIPVIFGK